MLAAYEITNLKNKQITWMGITSIKNEVLKDIAKKLQVDQSAINGIIKITRFV